MNRYSRIIFTAVLIAFLFCSAVIDDYDLLKKVPVSPETFLTTDNLGNAYIINNNQLVQFDSNGKELRSFSENNLGRLRYADAGNPLRLLLFYSDFARIIILDSKLAPQSTIDLRSLEIFQPVSVCVSEDNGFWIYDREDDQLKKLDNNLQVIHQSGSLLHVIGYRIQPGLMIEKNGFVYLNNPETGLLVFDRYGTYYKTIPYKGLSDFQVIDKDVLFINHGRLFRYDSKSLSEEEVLLPVKDSISSARIEQRQIYLLTSDSLSFYSF